MEKHSSILVLVLYVYDIIQFFRSLNIFIRLGLTLISFMNLEFYMALQNAFTYNL